MVEAAARRALEAYDLGDATLTPVEIGLINVTFVVTRGNERFILQRLNPIFSPAVHADIDAVTTHLAAKGMPTTRLVETNAKDRWVGVDDGVWRMLTYMEGLTHDRLQTPEQAREAGALLGRFHAAVADLDHEFNNLRLGVHDTRAHMATLRTALDAHLDHRLHGPVEAAATVVLARINALGPLPSTPDRVVHGDPKVSNIIFAANGEATCFIDLDTLARMPITLELGDAFRSWCNPGGEDQGIPTFSLPLFRAAVEGYASGAEGFLTDDERHSIVLGTRTILLELAARFLADALNESYFGWDSKRFETRGHHNLLRGQRQLAVDSALAKVQDEATTIVRDAFSSA